MYRFSHASGNHASQESGNNATKVLVSSQLGLVESVRPSEKQGIIPPPPSSAPPHGLSNTLSSVPPLPTLLCTSLHGLSSSFLTCRSTSGLFQVSPPQNSRGMEANGTSAQFFAIQGDGVPAWSASGHAHGIHSWNSGLLRGGC